MDHWLEIVAFVAGIVLVVFTGVSLMRTLIVPRGLSSVLTVAVDRMVRAVFLFVAARFNTYSAKDRILVLHGPVSLLALLVVWVVNFLIGFGAMLWAVGPTSWWDALRESGSSMLTLGFASTAGVAATMVDEVAAFTGLVVVALQIAYLPTLYGAFNRRELHVTVLQSRAGAPAWGPEILARHHVSNLMPQIRDLYREWERWAADVAETHASYPALINFRSPSPLRSWVLGLLAVMDSAAMYHALCPAAAPAEARLCLRMGFLCLRDIATTIGLPFDPDPFPDDPIELTYEDFAGGVKRLEEVDFPMQRTAEEAWPHFRGWRVNYESLVYALADRVVAPPGPWSGTRKHLPGYEIAPRRPADRKPEDVLAERPKGTGTGW